MAKTPPIGVRLDPDVKAGLERAAKADARSVSALAGKIISDWVAVHAPKPKKVGRRGVKVEGDGGKR